MFTPKKKLWSLTPSSEPGQKNGSVSGLNTNPISPRNGEASAKGKSVGFLQSDGIMDQASLTERVAKLENELFEYQYNMGLLLIEKKEWTLSYDELKQALADATDTLKREQAGRSSVISEAEKREENLKKALGVERQCVHDLEKALREIRSEYAEIKFNADSKLAEANALVTSVEEKSLEVEAKFHAADAKLAEISRKSSEIERKLHELEAQENALRRERSIFNTEREAHDTSISNQREDLREWERKLQEAEERLADGRRLLNQREERANANDKILKEKQNDLEELRKKIEMGNSALKNKEEDVRSRLASITIKEKEAEITHMEEKIKKREQAIEKKTEKVREKEMDFESKSKALKEKEKSLKIEEKNLEKERKQMLAETEDLLTRKAELENIKIDIEKLQQRLNEEREQLKVTEAERIEYARLQSELKEEIDKYRFQSEQLMKEADGLKQEKEKFEKEWEELDDKRTEIKKEQEDILEQKIYLEKLRHSEEEKLRGEKLETEQYVQRELEALKLAKDSFAASMEHEKSIYAEKTQSEKSQLVHDFEMRKQELETEMRRKQEERESSLQEREKSFEQEKEMELNNINYLREVAKREMEEMKLERLRMEKEKTEMSHNKKHVEAQQHEMKKDIMELVDLSQKLKDQREQFIKERERFIAFAEKQKNCNICGETISEFMLSDLHTLTEMKNLEAPPLPRVAENYLEGVEGTIAGFDAESSPARVNSGSPTAPGGTISWLRKCTTKIFKFSPGKKLELDYTEDLAGSSALPEKRDVDSPKTLPGGEMEAEPSSQVANDSFDVQIVESDSAIRKVEDPVNTQEYSQNSDLKARRRGPGKGGRPRTRTVKAVVTGSKTNGNAENSVYTNDESQTESDLVGTTKDRRKRNRVHGSQATVSDSQTEGHSDSIKDGDRPKRRQRVVAAEQSVGQRRYNLRQPKKSVGTTNGSLPQVRKGKENETDILPGLEADQYENFVTEGASREEIDECGVAAPLPKRFGGDEPVRSNNGASEFSADSPFKNAVGTRREHVVDDNMVLSEEVNGTAEEGMEYSGEEFKTESEGEEGDNNEDDEVEHPGQASIGKKFWNFLTT
ncbi:hypothetical protein ACP275_08G039700 [Erythranthe tilingii]